MTLGHQGGWDEVLTVLVPLAVFGFGIWLAARRASGTGPHDDSEDSATEDTPETD